MGELEALYRDVVLEHNRRPRNFRRLAAPCGCTDGVNPLCGDRLMVCLRLDGETVAEVAFEGSGCAIA
ncbi:MAG: iron-sulfur cluster assembly scaffold protein, partial [Gammaproteobacteria bacterium]|nr:iron-sulfur cluster assembly scaffold protein [Gammaproteobacteria bacterium]